MTRPRRPGRAFEYCQNLLRRNLRHKTIFKTSCICLPFMEVPGPVLLSLAGSFALFDFWAAASYVFLVLVLVILNHYSPSVVSAVRKQVGVDTIGRRCSFCSLQLKIMFLYKFLIYSCVPIDLPPCYFLFFYGGSNLLLASFLLIF